MQSYGAGEQWPSELIQNAGDVANTGPATSVLTTVYSHRALATSGSKSFIRILQYEFQRHARKTALLCPFSQDGTEMPHRGCTVCNHWALCHMGLSMMQNSRIENFHNCQVEVERAASHITILSQDQTAGK